MCEITIGLSVRDRLIHHGTCRFAKLPVLLTDKNPKHVNIPWIIYPNTKISCAESESDYEIEQSSEEGEEDEHDFFDMAQSVDEWVIHPQMNESFIHTNFVHCWK